MIKNPIYIELEEKRDYIMNEPYEFVAEHLGLIDTHLVDNLSDDMKNKLSTDYEQIQAEPEEFASVQLFYVECQIEDTEEFIEDPMEINGD